MNQCQNCGQINNAGSNFCRFCGTRMTMPQQMPARTNTPPSSFEDNPPQPYSWKTDEYQVSETKARKTQSFNYAPTAPRPVEPLPLARQYAPPAAIAYGYRCPRCGTQNMPRYERKISTAGWIVFAALLVFFFPLFWIGLLIKEDVRICSVCGVRV